MPYVAGQAPPAPGAGIAGSPGLPNNNTSTVGTSVQSTQVVKTIYEMDPYSIMREVVDRHDTRSMSTFRFLLEMLGMGRGVSAPTTGHYEADRRESLVKIGSIVTPAAGAGANAVLALHADAMYTFNPGQTASGVAVQASGIRLNEVIMFDNGIKAQVIAKNTTVNPHQITVRPLRSTQTLLGNVTAGSAYAILYNAYAEGTGLPDGKLPRVFKYTNTFQIVKEGYGVTGTAATDNLFAQFTPSTDGTVHGILNQSAMARFERNVSNTLLFGSQINNITAFNSALGVDVPVGGTEGMIDFVSENGHIPTYAGGGIVLDDFDNIGVIMTQEGIATNNVMMLLGYTLYQDIENLLFGYTTQNVAPLLKPFATAQNVSAETWSPFENEDFGFYVGFKAIKKSGYSFLMKTMPEFIDPTLAGAAAYGDDFSASGIIAPIGQTKDAQTGSAAPLWGYEWKQNANGLNRRAAFGRFSGVGASNFQEFGGAVNGLDIAQAGMLAEIGFHGACPNQVAFLRPA